MQYVLKLISLKFDKAKLYPNFAYWELIALSKFFVTKDSSVNFLSN